MSLRGRFSGAFQIELEPSRTRSRRSSGPISEVAGQVNRERGVGGRRDADYGGNDLSNAGSNRTFFENSVYQDSEGIRG